ncbi:MAG: PDZ domain-containing protein [Pirellulales bacterium]
MGKRMQFLALSLAGVIATATAVVAQQVQSTSLASTEESAIRAAVARVADSVVQIRTIGGLEEVDRTLLPDGPTTGLVISPDGWIVSSALNFVQQPASILVTFASGEQAPAELVAKDHSRMLVLVKAQGVSGLAVPELVPADEIRVGQWAIAVGRTFRADRPNISVGIVSALDRMFGKVMQTDADVSTANYGGPLVDIRGRVYGVVVPIAPQSTSEIAGAEWYDSGIGFAVPLASLDAPLERMKQGHDQRAGVMGIGLAAENAHDSPAEFATVLPTSPAGKAGFKKGDQVTEIDGRTIRTQTDLRFALGTKYAGDKVRVTAKRGEQELKQTIELVGELEPFRHAFLGILPLRSETEPEKAAGKKDDKQEVDSNAGVVVRMVYPGSPAAAAGIQPGDRIVKIDDSETNNIKAAIDAMNNVMPAADVAVRLVRNGKPIDLSLNTDRLPTSIAGDLPPAYAAPVGAAADAKKDAALLEMKLQDLKLAEFPETCRIYVPPSLAAGRPAGVLLWLHAPGEPPSEELFHEWQSICDRDGLLLVAPSSSDASRWERTELEYLRRLSERVVADYRVDPRRVVVFGQEGGGAMAYLLALVSRDLFNGVATTAAALPRTVDPPNAQPTARLAIFAGLPTDSSRLAQAQLGLKKLSDAGYPVTAATIANPDGDLSAAEREQLARWIDSLDRF